MQRQRTSLLIALFLLPGHAKAQSDTPPPMPLEQQEQLEQLEKANTAIHGLEAAIDEATKEKKNQCMKAIGNTAFCDCIAAKSPFGVNFVGYVSIVAGTKEDLHYDQLSPDDKKLFDATRASRDKCVDWKGKSQN